jgi:hypothetical protein
MEYRIRIVANGRSAKNKGIVTGRWTTRNEREDAKHSGSVEYFTIAARDHEDAFKQVSSLFRPADRRPLAGMSYIRHAALKPLKVGAKVRTVEPYAFNIETMQPNRDGVVTEIVSDRVVSVGFPGYHTQFVDFNLSELESR